MSVEQARACIVQVSNLDEARALAEAARVRQVELLRESHAALMGEVLRLNAELERLAPAAKAESPKAAAGEAPPLRGHSVPADKLPAPTRRWKPSKGKRAAWKLDVKAAVAVVREMGGHVSSKHLAELLRERHLVPSGLALSTLAVAIRRAFHGRDDVTSSHAKGYRALGGADKRAAAALEDDENPEPDEDDEE